MAFYYAFEKDKFEKMRSLVSVLSVLVAYDALEMPYKHKGVIAIRFLKLAGQVLKEHQ